MNRSLQSSLGRYRALLDAVGAVGVAPDARSKGKEPRRRLLAIRTWVGPHRSGLAGILALGAVDVAAELVWPATSAYVIDQVILRSELDVVEKQRRLLLAGVVLCAALSLKWALGWLRTVQTQVQTSRLAVTLRRRLFHHILRLPMSRVAAMRTGGILSRLTHDVDGASQLLESALLGPALAGLRLVVLLGILFSIDYRIALALVLSMPALLLWRAAKARPLRPIWRSLAMDHQETSGRLGEGLEGLSVVRAFRRERAEDLLFTLGRHTVIRKELLAINVGRRIATAWDLFLPLTQVGIVCGGGYLVSRGEMSLGVLVAVRSFAWSVFGPFRQLADSLSTVQRGLAAAERVSEVFSWPEDKADLPGAAPAPPEIREIRFESVSFGYTPDSRVFSDLDLTISGGTVVALTGPSGAGKTTLSHLLARFHDPTAGVIRLNGIDLRQIKLQSYRRMVAIVPQEVFLFDGSIEENIAYGRPEATFEEVEHASMRAHAHEFVERLPDRYETRIGEGGVRLSGGQRQRIAIARAFLADPHILILDEATSSLDTESEQVIQAAMPELLAGRTTLIIAHRLSTLAHADQIVVLGKGRVREQGTHADLIRRRGAYYESVQRQQRGEGFMERGPSSEATTAVRLSEPA